MIASHSRWKSQALVRSKPFTMKIADQRLPIITDAKNITGATWLPNVTTFMHPHTTLASRQNQESARCSTDRKRIHAREEIAATTEIGHNEVRM